jgi:hypothetical protein
VRELPREISECELEAFFTFSAAERRHIEQRRSPLLKLGLALQSGFLRMSGRSLDAASSSFHNRLAALDQRAVDGLCRHPRLAHGTALSAAECARMIPQLSARASGKPCTGQPTSIASAMPAPQSCRL